MTPVHRDLWVPTHLGVKMIQNIEVEFKRDRGMWTAVVRRNGIWLMQAHGTTENDVTQTVYLRLRELRDGIDAMLTVMGENDEVQP